jgi:acetyltransferase
VSYVIERLPTQLIDVWTLPSGRRVTVRPVLPQDTDLAQALVRGLSVDARTQRFFTPLRELSPAWLVRLTQVDYERHVALIAEAFGDDGAALPVAEARYVVDDEGAGAEFAVVVGEQWQRQGIARRLLESLSCHAAGQGLARMHGETMIGNAAMIALARSLGFHVARHAGDARLVRLERSLTDDADSSRCRATARQATPVTGY